MIPVPQIAISVDGVDRMTARFLIRQRELADMTVPIESGLLLARDAAVRRIKVGGEPAWIPSRKTQPSILTTRRGGHVTFGASDAGGSGRTGVESGAMMRAITGRIIGPFEGIVSVNVQAPGGRGNYAFWFQFGTGEYAGHSSWVIRPIHGPRDPRGLKKGNGAGRKGLRPLPTPVLAWEVGGVVFFARSVTMHGQPARPFLYFDDQLIAAIRETFRKYYGGLPSEVIG